MADPVGPLPVEAVLPALVQALGECGSAVLQAEPGAGKTTRVPLALLEADWLQGKRVLMLEPRRVAARHAAEYLARALASRVGQRVGLRMRGDSRSGPQVALEVVTEGVFTRMLQTDPALEDVGVVIFDEFHERSLDSDLGLSLLLQARQLLREDDPLRILVMSATIDTERIGRFLGGAPVLTSPGRQFPVAVEYRGPMPDRRDMVARCVQSVLDALATTEGDVLVFLPGRAEIRAAARLLEDDPRARATDARVMQLYGGLPFAEQREALQPSSPGERRIVLSTNLAETSLTIPGVTLVVDSGFVRRAVFNPGYGVTQLRTQRVSRAAAEQRAGRAGRVAPGRCIRLWSQEEHQSLSPADPPAISQEDLATLAMTLFAWGLQAPGELDWLDPPPPGRFAAACELLFSLGALAHEQDRLQLTGHGIRLLNLPLHPRLAHMILSAETADRGLACLLAAALEAGNGAGLLDLIEQPDRRPSAEIRREADRLARLVDATLPLPGEQRLLPGPDLQRRAARLLMQAYPDRLARRLGNSDGLYELSGGGRATVAGDSGVGRADWVLALSLSDVDGRRQIRQGLALPPALLDDALDGLSETCQVGYWDTTSGRYVAETQERLGQLVLTRRPRREVPPEERVSALADLLRAEGLSILDMSRCESLRRRVTLLREAGIEAPGGQAWPALSNEVLLASLEQWLLPAAADIRRLQDLSGLDLPALLQVFLPWPLPRELERLAPTQLQVPSGATRPIDYLEEEPTLRVKLQEMFGLETTPCIASGRIPLRVNLLSPAGRPLAMTRDLAFFWREVYPEVRREMRGRYPKHPWPEDPLVATATAATKRELRRD